MKPKAVQATVQPAKPVQGPIPDVLPDLVPRIPDIPEQQYCHIHGCWSCPFCPELD